MAPPPVDRSKVADVLARLRGRREINQSQLARELGFTQAYISKLETGLANYERMPLATVKKLSTALKFEMDDWATILEGRMPPRRRGSADTPADRTTRAPAPDLPEGLLEAGERYASRDPRIANPTVQAMLARQGNFGGRGPVSAEEWWRYFESVRQYIEVEE